MLVVSTTALAAYLDRAIGTVSHCLMRAPFSIRVKITCPGRIPVKDPGIPAHDRKNGYCFPPVVVLYLSQDPRGRGAGSTARYATVATRCSAHGPGPGSQDA
jgi:hypothetical protein